MGMAEKGEKSEELLPLPQAPLWKDRGRAELRVPRKGAVPDLKPYVWLHMLKIEGGMQATEAPPRTSRAAGATSADSDGSSQRQEICRYRHLEAFVFSMYEFCTNDLAMHGMALAAAYTVLDKHRGENGLYGPLYEGRWEVLSEHFKPY
jgi:hypothetical protein